MGITHGTVVSKPTLIAIAGTLLGRFCTGGTVGTQTDILVVAVGSDDVACSEFVAQTRCSGAEFAADGEACGVGRGIGHGREVLRIDGTPGLGFSSALHRDALGR